MEELVVQYPYRKGLSPEDRDKEAGVRLKFAHMLNGILQSVSTPPPRARAVGRARKGAVGIPGGAGAAVGMPWSRVHEGKACFQAAAMG